MEALARIIVRYTQIYGLYRVIASSIILIFFIFMGLALVASLIFEPELVRSAFNRAFRETSRSGPALVAFIVAVIAVFISATFGKVIIGLQRESAEYARKISRRDNSISATIGPFTVTSRTGIGKLRANINELRAELNAIKAAAAPIDTSNPDVIFQLLRQRLLDEAVRIDSISRRNLIIGILFSVIALGVLAWPLIAAAFQAADATQKFDVYVWAAQYYLPRFAVGVLLQFVGFFFLRLYVANELDLKHNKNEITNVELKMIAVQLAQAFGDASSKKEIMKSLAATERNFIIKKNERSASMEALTEHNDMKSILEKLINKIPGAK